MAQPLVFIGTVMFIFSLLYFYTPPIISIIGIISAFILYLLFTLIKHKNSQYVKIFALSVMIISVLFTGKNFTEYSPAVKLSDTNKHNVIAQIKEYPTKKYDGYYYNAKLISFDGKKQNCNIRIKTNCYYDVHIGDTVECDKMRIYTLSKEQKAKGYYIGGHTEENIKLLSSNKNKLYSFFTRLRETIDITLENNLPQTASGISIAILTGDTSKISNKLFTYFKFSGISHIFAVSGLHLTLWVSIIFSLTNVNKNKKLKGIISILFAIFFMFLAGFTKSVMRAGIMNIVYSLSLVSNKKNDSLNSLFASFIFLIFINPFVSGDSSFLMSFLSCFGLLIFGTFWLNNAERKTKAVKSKPLKIIHKTVSASLIISATASISLLPIFSLKNGTFSLLSPVTNLLCILPSQLLMIISVLGLILSPFKISKLFFHIAGKTAMYIIHVSEKIAKVPFLNVKTDTVFIKIFLLICTVTVFLLAYISLNGKRNMKKYFIIICVGIFSVMSFKLVSDNCKIKITVPYTENGSFVVFDYRGKTAVIGAGGKINNNLEFDKFLKSFQKAELSLFIVPRNSKTECSLADEVFETFDFEKTVISKSLLKSTIPNKSENTVYTDFCNVLLNDNCSVYFKNSKDFSGAYINSKETSVLILFKAVNDYSSIPAYMKKADLLISRYALPNNLDLSGFKSIIVETNRVKNDDSPILYTSKENLIQLEYKKGVFQ